MSHKKELEFAKKLADEAGKIMRRYFHDVEKGTTWKKDNTPLTIADTKINKMVIESVQKEFPGYGVLGEEESYMPERSMIWVVDPIDGTVPFSAGIPVSTFSLGLVDRIDGQAVVALVLDPFLDHFYSSSVGNSAFLNDKAIKTSETQELNQAFVSIIGGTGNKEFRPGICFDLIRSEGAKCMSFMSSAYSACKVASGDFAGHVFGYGSPWDSAAVSLIVQEAGGMITDLSGKKRRFDEWGNGCVFAANKDILDQLLNKVEKSTVKG